MKKLLQRIIRDDSGATSIQYGLIAVLIAVAIIGGAKNLGAQVKNNFNSVATNMKNA